MTPPVIENLTNWRTEDLEAYFNRATLDLVAAGRDPGPKVVKIVHWRGSDLVAECTYDTDTRVGTVKIPRPKRFESSAIDMLAATLNGGANQLPPTFRASVGHVVERVLIGSWGRSPGYGGKPAKCEWAELLPIRTQSKRAKIAPAALKRELEVLKINYDGHKERYESHLRQLANEIEAKEEALRSIGVL